MEASAEADWVMLCRPENLLNFDDGVSVPETDTGGKVEKTKGAREKPR